MTDWNKYKLGQLAEIKGGKRLPKGNLLVDFDTGHPYIRVTDLGNKWVKKQGLQFVTPDIQKKIARYTVNKGDVIISIVGSIGVIGKISNELDGANLTENCMKFVLKYNILDNDFLYYFLISNIGQDEIEKRTVGSTQPKLPLYNIKDIDILLPSLNEQTKIAGILSSLDDKIDLLHRQNKTLEALAETLFRQWFIEEADENWETLRVYDVADINTNTIQKNSLYSEIEYLDTGSITKGIIDGFQYYKLIDAPSRAQRIVQKYDIVYSLVRPIQRHYGLLYDTNPNTVVSTGFCVITCSNISPYFLYLLLTTDESVEHFDMIAEGSTSTYPSLKPSDIANFEFQKPPNDKLIKFDNVVSCSWNKIISNNRQIRTLTQLRDTLLPKLMSGEVRVNFK